MSCALLQGPAALGQAGSTPPVIIDSNEAFYAMNDALGSVNLSGGSPPAMRPSGVLKIPRDQRYLLWVELSRGLLHLLQQQSNGGLITRKIIPVSIGKNGYGKEVEGDKRTPVGIYRFTSFLDDERLIDYYGLGAYPLNYPNALDRMKQRTGYGIWLHGLPKDVNERPLLDSDGCVVIDNDSLLEMADYIDTGNTHIVLSRDQLQWQPVAVSQQRVNGLHEAFEQWRQAWEARDNRRYLAFYAEDFSDLRRDKESWASYKTRVNNSKSWIEVETSQLSIFADPENPDLVTVRFYQDYDSSNYSWRGWKEQWWVKSEQGWQILYEGNG